MRFLFRIACFFAAVCLASVMFLGWTSTGLKLLLEGVNRIYGDTITVQSVSGTLLTSWQLQNVLVKTPAVHLKAGELSSSWQPTELLNTKIHVLSLAGRDIDVHFQEQTDTVQGGTTLNLPKLALPFSFLLDTLALDNLRLFFPDRSEITFIEHLSFGLAGSMHTAELIDFTLVSAGYSATLQGLLDTERDWYIELAGNVEYKEYGIGPFAADISLKGPLARLDTVVDLHQPASGHIEGQIRNLPHGFNWQADLELTDVQLADGHEILPELFFSVRGKAEGDLRNYGGKLTGKLDYLFFKDVSVEIELAGDYDKILFEKVNASNTQGQAFLRDGLLAWNEGLRWHGKLRLDEFDPAQLNAAYPGSIHAELSSSGKYDGILVMNGDISSLSGLLRGYQVKGAGNLQVAEHTVFLKDFLLESGKASMKIDGRVEMAKGLDRWRESLVWKAGIELAGFDPALVLDGYPGELDAELTSEGRIAGEDIQGRADIGLLRGVVRGYPVNGKGGVRFDDQVLNVDDVVLKSGHSQLQISGQAGEQIDLAVMMNSENLGEFIEGAGGELKIDGTVAGKHNMPQIDAAITAKKLAYEDGSIAILDASVSGGVLYDSSLSAIIRGEGLNVGGLDLDAVALDLSGLLGDHTFTVALEAADGTVDLSGKGTLDNHLRWSGEIAGVNISHLKYGEWLQEGVASAAVSAQKSGINSLCLKSQAESSCLSGDWLQNAMSWSAELNWNQLDLARLNDLISIPEPVWGTSSAALSVAGNLNRLLTATGYIEVVDGGVGRTEELSEWEKLHLDTALLSFKLADAILSGELAANFADGSVLEVMAEIPGAGSFIQNPGTLPLRGTIHADIHDLGFIAPLSYYMVRPSGSLQGNIDISGTLAQPVVAGNLLLADGKIDMPPLGISMTDASFELTGTGSTLNIQGTASSGPGWLRAGGTLFMDTRGVAGDFRFVGENFETVMLPEYEVRTSPDLHLAFNRDGGTLTGSVVVPHAVLTPEEMKDSLSVSDDVIYLNGVEKKTVASWMFTTLLRVKLGEDVFLDGYGLTGYLRGNLEVEKTPGAFMTGKGAFSLAEGVFSIYGRTLDIVRSRVLFSGGPIDNPGVDVRAEKIVANKKIPGDTMQVGVDVSGTVDNLEFALFSDPAMDESDILSYMVVGRSMSDMGKQEESLLNSVALALGLEKSIGFVEGLTSLLPIDEMYLEGSSEEDMSLVVGKQLTDELYIGYDHNFFDQKGEVKVRYKLGSGFSVETRSSAGATGADLLYSFEK